MLGPVGMLLARQDGGVCTPPNKPRHHHQKKLTLKSQTTFKVLVPYHLALINPAETALIPIPTGILPSKDEDADKESAYAAAPTNLPSDKQHVETFASSVHGRKSARADLSEETIRKEYQRVYASALFGEHLWIGKGGRWNAPIVGGEAEAEAKDEDELEGK